jgi:hypothetical protein
MDNIFVKVTKVFTIFFMVAAVVFTALVIMNADDMKTDPALASKLLNMNFGLGYFLFGFGVLTALAFALAQMISTPKTAFRALASIAILGFVYLLAYLSASGNVDAEVYQTFEIDSTASKLIGSLIYLVYILGGLSLLAIVYSGINNLLLKR